MSSIENCKFSQSITSDSKQYFIQNCTINQPIYFHKGLFMAIIRINNITNMVNPATPAERLLYLQLNNLICSIEIERDVIIPSHWLDPMFEHGVFTRTISLFKYYYLCRFLGFCCLYNIGLIIFTYRPWLLRT